jgi:hypothetical protein
MTLNNRTCHARSYQQSDDAPDKERERRGCLSLWESFSPVAWREVWGIRYAVSKKGRPDVSFRPPPKPLGEGLLYYDAFTGTSAG